MPLLARRDGKPMTRANVVLRLKLAVEAATVKYPDLTKIAVSPHIVRHLAVVMSLLQSAKLHGHDPWAYLKDVLTRLPGHMNSRIAELLPRRWQPKS